jgi:hypothetical protein
MDLLPPPPLRLLPAATTSHRVGITPTENPNLFTTHALNGRPIIQIKGTLFRRPCRGLLSRVLHIPGVTRRAAALHPRLLLLWRLRRKKVNGNMVNILRSKWMFPGERLDCPLCF